MLACLHPYEDSVHVKYDPPTPPASPVLSSTLWKPLCGPQEAEQGKWLCCLDSLFTYLQGPIKLSDNQQFLFISIFLTLGYICGLHILSKVHKIYYTDSHEMKFNSRKLKVWVLII